MLLKDDNGQRIDLITKGLIGAKATEAVLKEWLTGNIPDTNPYPRTYRHLVECINESGMGALAEHIETTLFKRGMLSCCFSCVMFL